MDDTMIDRAVGAMPVYRVGIRFDGTPALSYSGDTPDMDTEVWFADDPGTKMTAFEAADLTDVSWLATPKEWTEPKVAAAAPPEEREGYESLDLFSGATAPEEAPVDPMGDEQPLPPAEEPPEAPVEEQVDELSEAELDEMSEAVELAEERVGELEALVASVILAQVKDGIFEGDDDAKVASAPLPVTAAQRVRVAEGFAVVGEFLAVTAALTEQGGLPEDLATRLAAVTERLDALEDSIGKLMLGDMTDEKLPEAPEGASTFVDETLDEDVDPEAAGEGDEEPEGDEGDEEDEEDEAPDEEPEDEDEDAEDTQRYPRKKKKKMKKAPPFKGAKAAATGLPLTVDAREKAADEGAALPDGKLPIRTLVELKSAIKLRNNVKGHSPEAVKAHIVKRARALGATDELPDDWS